MGEHGPGAARRGSLDSPTSTPLSVAVRERTAEDLPALVEVLGRQQPDSGYPFRWPLSFPAEEFIARASERAAWVAEIDKAVVGHVSVIAVSRTEHPAFLDAWQQATGRGPEELGCLSVLFTDLAVRGRGVGRALLQTAETWITEHGLIPVLDVIPVGVALQVYLGRGWRSVGRARPEWLPASAPAMHAMVLDRQH